MQEIYKDNEQDCYAVIRNADNFLMTVEGDFTSSEWMGDADLRTSPNHWKKYGIEIPSDCRVVKIHRWSKVAISEI